MFAPTMHRNILYYKAQRWCSSKCDLDSKQARTNGTLNTNTSTKQLYKPARLRLYLGKLYTNFIPALYASHLTSFISLLVAHSSTCICFCCLASSSHLLHCPTLLLDPTPSPRYAPSPRHHLARGQAPRHMQLSRLPPRMTVPPGAYVTVHEYPIKTATSKFPQPGEKINIKLTIHQILSMCYQSQLRTLLG